MRYNNAHNRAHPAMKPLRVGCLEPLGLMIIRSLVVVLFAVIAVPVSAAETTCSLSEQRWISNELPNVKSWASLYKSFRQYGPRCDDGFIAEGYTEAVVMLLAKRWSLLHELAAVAKRDPSFGQFVLRHIDASAATDDLFRIKEQAGTQCFLKHKAFCASIQGAAVKAIEDRRTTDSTHVAQPVLPQGAGR